MNAQQMDFTRKAICEAFPEVFHRWQQTPGEGPYSYKYRDGNGWHSCREDNPLRDANAAMLVVDMMAERTWRFSTHHIKSKPWHVCFWKDCDKPSWPICHEADAQTLPIAIYKAALLALSLWTE